MREDIAMNSPRPIRVMQVIARMNVGGPAVLVADLMRSLNSVEFESILVTGFCDENTSVTWSFGIIYYYMFFGGPPFTA